MAPDEHNFTEIKDFFEKDLGWQIRLQLVNKQYLIKDYLPDYPNESNVGYQSTCFEWKDHSFANVNGDIWTFNVALYTKGNLIFYGDIPKEEREIEISLNLWLEIPGRYYESSRYFSFLPEAVMASDQNLKTINDFDKLVLLEYNKLTKELEDLDPATIQKVWPYNEAGNNAHIFISSHDYFLEIENIYRQVRYSVALARTYVHYANRYSELQSPHYNPLNMTSHDRRYLDFCTLAIQNIYTYWERLALLIFQYKQPEKIQQSNLSFNKLIRAIIKEQKVPMAKKVDIRWLEHFYRMHHFKLQDRRHPLVHFKLSGNEVKGSF